MVGGGWGLQSHFIVKSNLVLRLGWGFDNIEMELLSVVANSDGYFALKHMEQITHSLITSFSAIFSNSSLD